MITNHSAFPVATDAPDSVVGATATPRACNIALLHVLVRKCTWQDVQILYIVVVSRGRVVSYKRTPLTEDGANIDTLVRAQVVNEIRNEDVRYPRDRALGVGSVVISWTGDSFVRPKDVHLSVGVRIAKTSARNDRNGVVQVVDAYEVRDLGRMNQRRSRETINSRPTFESKYDA